MKKERVVNDFLQEICLAFPEVAARIEKHDSVMTTSRMEEFSKITTEAILAKDEERAKKYLNFISKKLDNANSIEKEYIDVYYVEVLLYGVTEEIKKYAWQLIPSNLQSLYTEFWGDVF